MGRRIAAVDPALCDPFVTHSRVGTHCSGAQFPRDALFKGCNISVIFRRSNHPDTHTPLLIIYLCSKEETKKGIYVVSRKERKSSYCALGERGLAACRGERTRSLE